MYSQDVVDGDITLENSLAKKVQIKLEDGHLGPGNVKLVADLNVLVITVLKEDGIDCAKPNAGVWPRDQTDIKVTPDSAETADRGPKEEESGARVLELNDSFKHLRDIASDLMVCSSKQAGGRVLCGLKVNLLDNLWTGGDHGRRGKVCANHSLLHSRDL
jgi:hypothetical protein